MKSTPKVEITSDSDSDEDEVISSEELQKAVQLASKAIASSFQNNQKETTKLHHEKQLIFSNKLTLGQRLDPSFSKNPLSELIPGYIAPMKLDSSGLDPYKSKIKTQLTKAQTTDESTKDFTLSNNPTTKSNPIIPTISKTMHARNLHAGANTSTTHSAGPQWFNMTSTPMTDELTSDLRILEYRNYLDPKKFYKSADKVSKSKHRIVQLGTVIEGHGEFYSNRLSQKDRRMNLTEEIMNDDGVNRYTSKTYRKIFVANEKKGKGRMTKKGQRSKFRR